MRCVKHRRPAAEKPRYDGRWRPENCVGKPIPEGVITGLFVSVTLTMAL